jgi:hypothetical protein
LGSGQTQHLLRPKVIGHEGGRAIVDEAEPITIEAMSVDA